MSLAQHAIRPSLVKKGAPQLSFLLLRNASHGVVAPSPKAGWERGLVPRLRTDKLGRSRVSENSTIPELVGNPYTVGSTTEGAKGYENRSHQEKEPGSR